MLLHIVKNKLLDDAGVAVVVLDRELAAVVLVYDLPDPCVDREGFDAVQPEQEHAVGDLIADAVDAFQVGAGLLGLHAGQLMQVDPAVGDVLGPKSLVTRVLLGTGHLKIPV